MRARTHARVALAAAMLTAGGVCLSAQGGAPTLEQARSATYSGIYDKAVTLTGGVYEGTPFIEGGAMRPRVELIDPGSVTGDVGNDSKAELVVLLSESSGGSGDSLYVAVLATDGRKARNLATALVGNRVQVRSLAVVTGAIVMETVQVGPGDAMCCPTAKLRRSWTLEKGALKEAKAEPQGTVSLADLEGRLWTLTSLNGKDPLPPGVTVTAEFKIANAPAGRMVSERLDGSTVGGSSGCNRYNARVKPGDDAQSLAIGPAAATRMMCDGDRMAVEDAFLKAITQVSSFSFLPGNRMALAHQDETGPRRLVFVGAPR